MKKNAIAILVIFCLLCVSLHSQEKELLILITNDDGIDSPGLYALAKEMTSLGSVIVVAPKTNQSGTSHSTKRNQPTFFGEKELVPGVKSYWVDNTPVVCVLWGIAGPLEGVVPDLVVSGINEGPNPGPAYGSGTVSAAREGALAGATAIAASQFVFGKGTDYEGAAIVVRQLAQTALSMDKKPILWNVNIPGGKIDSSKKIIVTEMTRRWRKMRYVVNQDIQGRSYFWFERIFGISRIEPESDFAYLLKGYITVTPHLVYPTNAAAMEKVRAILHDNEGRQR
jgi:5'-nucleotidase